MAGHMGTVRNTTQNIEVVSVDDDDGVILLCGAVPGPKNGWVLISDAIKGKPPKDAPFPAGLVGKASANEVDEASTEKAASDNAPLAEAADEAPSAAAEDAAAESEKE